MVHANVKGIGFSVIGLAFGYLLAAAFGLKSENAAESWCMFFGGPVTACLDLRHRLHRRASLWRGAGGGHLMWIPIWIIGLIWHILGAGRLIWPDQFP